MDGEVGEDPAVLDGDDRQLGEEQPAGVDHQHVLGEVLDAPDQPREDDQVDLGVEEPDVAPRLEGTLLSLLAHL